MKTARAPLVRCKSVLMLVEKTLFRKKLARVIRDDCANQASESKLTRDFNDRPNQNCSSNSLPVPSHKRQSGLRITTIVIVRPASHLLMSCNTSCEKSADRTAPVSACVRLCSTAKSNPTNTSRQIPTVAYRAILLKRFRLMLDVRAAWPGILPLMVSFFFQPAHVMQHTTKSSINALRGQVAFVRIVAVR